MTTEVIEVVEQETLIERVPEQLVITLDAEDQTLEDPVVLEQLVDTGTDLLVVDAEQLVTLLDTGTQGPPGPPGEAGSAYIEFPAAVPLGGNRCVRLVAGEAVYADNTTLADANLVLGLTRGAVAEGAQAQIQTTGLMTEVSWAWTTDAPVFVGANGVPVQPAPATGFQLIVGVATSPTQIFIGAKMPIVLE